jgi:ribosomal protein S18 acetylase RimI-like enzyme
MADHRNALPLIAHVTEKDISALDILVNSAYRGESSKKGWTTEADLLGGLRTDKDSLSKLITEPGGSILKYSGEDGNLQGCVYLKIKGSKLYLGMLTVSPELQAKGIGKKLLFAAETHARKSGCTSVIMTVISVRHELIAWYERHGYRPTGETEPFPTDPKFGLPKQPLVFIVMEKVLQD